METENEWLTCLMVALGFAVCFGLTYLVNSQKKKIREMEKQKQEWETKR